MIGKVIIQDNKANNNEISNVSKWLRILNQVRLKISTLQI